MDVSNDAPARAPPVVPWDPMFSRGADVTVLRPDGSGVERPPRSDVDALEDGSHAALPDPRGAPLFPGGPPRTVVTSGLPPSPAYTYADGSGVGPALVGKFRLLLADTASLTAAIVTTQKPTMGPPPPVAGPDDAFTAGGLVYYTRLLSNAHAVLMKALAEALARDVFGPLAAARGALPPDARSVLVARTSDARLAGLRAVAHGTRDLMRAIAQKCNNAAALPRAMAAAGVDVAGVPPCDAFVHGPGETVLHAVAADVAGWPCDM